MNLHRRLLSLLLLLISFASFAYQPSYSTAGFYATPGSGREAHNMNVAWRYTKGDVPHGEAIDIDDTTWEVVSLPHGLEYLPSEASGCINYQGVVWYRKHITPDKSLADKKLTLYFEGIMGKSKIYVNGRLMKEHFGGFLPIIVDVSDALIPGERNLIAVCADNSNDPAYPPGKPQNMLDFAYFGGIYRDCWLVSHNRVYITDPNLEAHVAGGGLFASYADVSEQEATVRLQAEIKNETLLPFDGKVGFTLTDKSGKVVASTSRRVKAAQQGYASTVEKIRLRTPKLWSPEDPHLYTVEVKVTDARGKSVDGYKQRIGVRGIEFKGKEGFWLNGKPYPSPLIGANRHQDFAIIGNAMPNSLHWRDAKKLRDAGLKVIRNAHYPQDPAFMDACDELGLFVIINTPGWQFWNDAAPFEARVYSDIRQMIRRDRNHASLFMWEPILNETHYPETFAQNALACVSEEYPFPYSYSGADNGAQGSELFPVQFCHPALTDVAEESTVRGLRDDQVSFTREWGDNVDDWNAHNSPSRVYRGWGEEPMRIQADYYANPPFSATSYDRLFRTSRRHVGGCLWHSFDHQRGYHPDAFYGGIMDAFRQPKTSYYLFASQRNPKEQNPIAERGPMIFIAHAMTPFSGGDVPVYTNCDSVVLTLFEGGKQCTYKRPTHTEGMMYPIITFPAVYDFMADKALSRKGEQSRVYMLAEGYIDGKLAASHKVAPARRPDHIVLQVDHQGTDHVADGSDKVVVIASVVDKNGEIKRLNNYRIAFRIRGEGVLVGDDKTGANPANVTWGTAPVLVQSTHRPGTITLQADVWFEGEQMPLGGEITWKTIAPSTPLIYNEQEAAQLHKKTATTVLQNSQNSTEIKRLEKELNELKLREVERQQEDFGEKETTQNN